MAVYRRGGVWWYGFTFNGNRVQESTKQHNKRVAETMEAAHRTSMAKGEVGIRERAPSPRLRDFKERFMSAIRIHCATKPSTIAFYEEKLDRILEFEPLASARLNEIDESAIEAFVQKRRGTVAPATVNRSLATLRRLLRLAYEWKLLDRVPRIRMLPGERNREFVLNHAQESLYLAVVPQPLHDVAVLILDTGLRVGEALSLTWEDIHFRPAKSARYGYLHVQKGKSKNARRTVSLTARVVRMLREREKESKSAWVFPGDSADAPFVGTSLDHQQQKTRELLKMPDDFVIHSLRHTMLTRLGEAGVDAFTIMRIAGHSSITVSQRYVHPSNETMERAFERLESLNGRMAERLAPVHGPTTIPTTPVDGTSVAH
jgi:integrase